MTEFYIESSNSQLQQPHMQNLHVQLLTDKEP